MREFRREGTARQEPGFRDGLFIIGRDLRPLPAQLGPQQGAEILLPEMNQGKRFRGLPDYQAFSHFNGIGGTAVQG